MGGGAGWASRNQTHNLEVMLAGGGAGFRQCAVASACEFTPCDADFCSFSESTYVLALNIDTIEYEY